MNCDVKERLRAGEALFGTWVTIGHTDVADVLEAAGFDWLLFDAEHAPLGPESLSRMIQAVDPSKSCPIVRVGALDQYMAKSALDMGAHGVMFPLVNSGEEAERAVRFTKYPPVGIRGVAPRKAADYGLGFADYIRKANGKTLVVAQIETKESISNLDEIVGTSGVDIAFVGPSDLTMNLGLLDDRGNEKVIDSMKKVVAACRRVDKTAGVLAVDLVEAKKAVSMGFSFIGLGSDTRFLLQASGELLGSARRSAK